MRTRIGSVVVLAMSLAAGFAASADSAAGKYAEYVKPDAIVSVARAKQLMETLDNVVVVHVSEKEKYDEGHIPGAVNVWRPAYGSSKGEYEYRGMRAKPEKFHKLLGELGIGSDTTVIVYSKIYDAYRFAWLLKMYGHDPAKVLVIDGNLGHWKKAGYPVSTDAPETTAVEYKPTNPVDESALGTMEAVREAIGRDNMVIVDTRTPWEWWGIAQFTGAFRKGRIPSSVHVNFEENLDEDGLMKPAAELKSIYAKVGATSDKTIISYCQSGVRCAMTNLVLSDLLGYPDSRNYDGSWVEWTYHRDNPVVGKFLVVMSVVLLAAAAAAVAGMLHFGKKGGKTVLGKVAAALVILYIVFLMWYYNIFSMVSADGVGQLQAWIESFGIFGPLVFILLFVLACVFFLPGAPFGIVGGIVFGPIMGTVWVSIGATIGASIAFLLGRYALRGFAEKLIEKNPKLKKIDDGVNKNGWRMLMITRFVPIFPFNVQNYVYGLTKIPFLTYVFLSWLFMLPGTIAYVFIAGAAASGANLKTIMIYFAIGAIILVGLSFVPKLLKKKAKDGDILAE